MCTSFQKIEQKEKTRTRKESEGDREEAPQGLREAGEHAKKLKKMHMGYGNDRNNDKARVPAFRAATHCRIASSILLYCASTCSL
jgi:hypothetical protein